MNIAGNITTTDSTKIENIFTTIFTTLQPEPFVKSDDKTFTDRFAVIDSVSPRLVDDLNEIFDETSDPAIMKNIVRLKTFVEYFRLYAEAFKDRKPGDLDRLIRFSKDHPDQQMVVMYPEYIRWRLKEYFEPGK